MKCIKDTPLKLFFAGTLSIVLLNVANATETNLVSVTNNMTLTWNWAEEYMFHSDAVTNGSISGSTNGWYLADTTNALQAVPNSGYYFDRWSGDDVPTGAESNNPLAIMLDGPKTNLWANFLDVPQPHISGFDGTSLGITNLVPLLEYAVQETTDLVEPAWKEKVLFTAASSYTNISIVATNSPDFLRIEYQE